MFDHRHYVPVLKSKLAEFGALETASSPTKNRMTPLVEITPADNLKAEQSAAKLAKESKRIVSAWGSGRAIFVDQPFLDEDEESDGDHPVTTLFNNLRTSSVDA